MKKLLVKLLRDIRLSMGQFIAVTLVIAIGTIFFTGFTITHKSLENSVDQFYKDQNLSNLWIYYQGIDDDGISKIKSLDHVNNAEGRLKLEATLASGKAGEFTIHTLAADTEINVPRLLEGTLPKDSSECIIDTGYAKANKVQLGDLISININDKAVDLKISGIYISPEYIYLVKSIDDLLPNHEKFGVLFLHHDFVLEFSGLPLYNEVIVDTKEGTDTKLIQKDIEEKTNAYGYGYGYDLKYLISYVMLDADVDQLEKMGVFFPNIFFLVAAVIIFISLSRRVELERNQVGIMKALGIRSSAILLHFLGFAVLTGLIGCFIGSLIGIYLLPQALYSSYAIAYTLPEIHPHGFVNPVVIATVLSMTFGFIATIFSCRKTLIEVPAQAMRPKMPKHIKPILFEKNEWLWHKISYNKKLMLRNIFVNKKRAILSSIGIIGCVGLIIASLAMNDAMNGILDKQFNVTNRYDISVGLKMPLQTMDEVTLEDNNIKGIYKQAEIQASFTPEGKDLENTVLNVLQVNNDVLELRDQNNRKVKLPSDGIILSQDYANRYKIKLGDTVRLTLTPPFQKSVKIDAVVKGIGMMYLSQELYTSFEYLQSLNISPEIETLLLTVNDATEVSETVEKIKTDTRVKSAISKEETASKVMDSMKIMDTFIAIMIAASAVLALTVMFNISAINIFERRRDIATLKVLGYYTKEVNSLVFTENLFITAFGSILGIGFGAFTFKGLIKTMIPQGMMLPSEIKPQAIIIAVVLGFVFTILANQMLRIRIKKIDMVESLKSVE